MTLPVSWFDDYKARYPSMTFSDLVKTYNLIKIEYPHQAFYHSIPVIETLKSIKDPRVLELGGWDGGLAQRVMAHARSWVNYDIITVPQVCHDSGYHLRILQDWFWNSDIPNDFNVFVATHVVEHLSIQQFDSLLSKLESLSNIKVIHLECPLDIAEGNHWKGTIDTHILPLGWDGIRKMIERHGFSTKHKYREICVARRK